MAPPTSPVPPSPQQPPPAIVRLVRRLLWLGLFMAVAYGALILAWVVLRPRI